MSEERKKIIRCLGAELVLTPAELSIDGSVKRAEELLDEIGPPAINQPVMHPAIPY